MFQSRAQAFQRALDISQTLPRLFVSVVFPDNFAVRPQRGCAGYVNPFTDLDSARVTNNWRAGVEPGKS